MQIKIYQLDPIRAGNKAATAMLLDVSEVLPSAYNLVFAGDVIWKNLSELCAVFRRGTSDHRAMRFHGHGLRTNDLVEIIEGDSSKLYQFESNEVSDGTLRAVSQDLCDKLNAAKNVQTHIFGVYAEPGKLAQIRLLDLKEENFRSFFGSGYEILRLSDNRYCVCSAQAVTHCNLETVYDVQMNRILRSASDNEVIAAIRGPVFFCGSRVDEQTENIILHSLNARECQELLRQYRLPERFYEYNGEIRSVPYYPSSCVQPCL